MPKRRKGALECTTPSRLREVVRLVAIGKKVGEIGRCLGIGTVRARQLVLHVVRTGMVDSVQDGRDESVETLRDLNRELAMSAHLVLQQRMDEILESEEPVSRQEVRDAFSILEHSEVATFAKTPKEGGSPAPIQNNIAIFSPEQLRNAKDASERIGR